MSKQKNNTENPESLYQDGDQIHTHTKDAGYVMDPESQGLHGQGQKRKNRELAESRYSENYFLTDPLCIAGAGLIAAGAALLAYRFIDWDYNPFKTESTNGENKDLF